MTLTTKKEHERARELQENPHMHRCPECWEWFSDQHDYSDHPEHGRFCSQECEHEYIYTEVDQTCPAE